MIPKPQNIEGTGPKFACVWRIRVDKVYISSGLNYVDTKNSRNFEFRNPREAENE